MKKLLWALLISLNLVACSEHTESTNQNAVITSEQNTDAIISSAFQNHQSNLQVSGQGSVIKILPDDTQGDQHQKFILELSSGQTLLIAHNIDIAPKITGLQTGDTVKFHGEYEWNEKGGVVHWTHHDSNGVHENGWLEHKGQQYQ